jgi:hypothetical protein
MSGPLSSNEIEDVVSSVRRLVSVDVRPRPVSRDLVQDRLVLTPAQRVVPEMAAETLILTSPVLDDAPDPLAEAGPDLPPAPPSLDLDSAPHTFEAEWEEELWAEPEAPLAERALEAEEAEIVVDDVVDVGAEAAAHPDGDEAPWAEVADDWLADDVGPVLAAKAAADAEAAAAAPAPADDPALKPGLRPSVLELSAADMLTDGDGNPLTVLDEAALQQIIRHLIHEELKGALGERITQNVRKLVRAEINRALAAHDLD